MSVLLEADKLINGARQEAYGDPAKHFDKVAVQWATYLFQKYGLPVLIDAEDVCWMMADFKKVRQMHRRKKDNLVDAAGYIGLVEKLGE